jgi:hypothetical protein
MGAALASLLTTASCGATESDPPAPSLTSQAASPALSDVVLDEVAGLVASCIEYVPVAAYLGDAEMIAIIAEAEADTGAVERRCREIILDDPQRVANMVAQLEELAVATATTNPAPATSAATVPPTTPPAPPAAVSALMPDVVCLDLQSAQNAIQGVGVFFSRSVDATGNGRMQINDSNWLVVAQDPLPGTPIGEGDAVLAVIKFGEGNC